MAARAGGGRAGSGWPVAVAALQVYVCRQHGDEAGVRGWAESVELKDQAVATGGGADGGRTPASQVLSRGAAVTKP